MSAVILRHPNADATPPPRRGRGRLPKSVTFLPEVRRERAILERATEKPVLYLSTMRALVREGARAKAEARRADLRPSGPDLSEERHKLAVLIYQRAMAKGRPITLEHAEWAVTEGMKAAFPTWDGAA